jgi:hypothetical protein
MEFEGKIIFLIKFRRHCWKKVEIKGKTIWKKIRKIDSPGGYIIGTYHTIVGGLSRLK